MGERESSMWVNGRGACGLECRAVGERWCMGWENGGVDAAEGCWENGRAKLGCRAARGVSDGA